MSTKKKRKMVDKSRVITDRGLQAMRDYGTAKIAAEWPFEQLAECTVQSWIRHGRVFGPPETMLTLARIVGVKPHDLNPALYAKYKYVG